MFVVPVMIVVSAKTVNVHGDVCRLCKALQQMRDHLGAEIADLLPSQAQVDDREGTAREIHDRAGQCLVQRCICVSEPFVSTYGAERLLERGAEGNSAVLGRVMIVDYGQPACSFPRVLL